MAIVYGVRLLRSPDTPPNLARLVRLALTWTIVPLLFFSFARTKLPNYVALELPALALITALYFDAVIKKGTSRSIIVSSASVCVVIGLVAFAITLFVRDNKLADSALSLRPDLIIMGASIFVGSLVTAVMFARREWMAYAPLPLSVAMLVAIDVLAIGALPRTEAFKPIPAFAATIQAERKPGDVVAIQSFRGTNALVFYTGPTVLTLSPPGERNSDEGGDAQSVFCSHARIWLVAPVKRPAVDPLYGRTRTVVQTDGSGALYLVDGKPCS